MALCSCNGLRFAHPYGGPPWCYYRKENPETVADYIDPPESAWGKQEGGAHYQSLSIGPLEYGMKNKLNPLQFSIIKYVTRYPLKGQALSDLKKARDCLDKLIEEEEKNS